MFTNNWHLWLVSELAKPQRPGRCTRGFGRGSFIQNHGITDVTHSSILVPEAFSTALIAHDQVESRNVLKQMILDQTPPEVLSSLFKSSVEQVKQPLPFRGFLTCQC